MMPRLDLYRWRVATSSNAGPIDVISRDDTGHPTVASETPPLAADYLAAESLRPGMQLNGVYEIDALLARGGMGEVYKGHAIQTGDQVAIKVIRADLAENEVAIALFRNEASKLYRLHHEAIIRYFVFSVDPLLQRTYLAMEFVEGEPLSQLLRRGPMPVEMVQRLAQRVALGLHAAHKREIVHRDVSSDNIIIQNGDVGEAKIIDFGIARSTHAATTVIDVGFAGKLNYVSPEQLGLYGGDVTIRSDIYSLGLVLLEALKGAPADMGGSQVQVIEKRKQVPSLAGVDPRIRPLLEKMLQPNPDDRPQSMQEVADYFARLPSSAAGRRGARGGGPAATNAAKQRGLLLAAAAGATLALIGLGAGAYLWLAPTAKAPEVQVHPDVTLQPPAEEPSAIPEDAPLAPTAPKIDRESILGFVERYAAGPCFSITSVNATDTSAKIVGLGGSRDPFDALNTAFREENGFEADIQAILVPAAQCAALDFYNFAKTNALLAPRVQLETPFPRLGGPLTGSVTGAKDSKIEAFLVADDGAVQSLTGVAQPGRSQNFNISVARPKIAAQPQLLIIVAAARTMASFKPAKPLKASQFFPAVAAEAAEKHEQLGVTMDYFYVVD